MIKAFHACTSERLGFAFNAASIRLFILPVSDLSKFLISSGFSGDASNTFKASPHLPSIKSAKTS